MLTDALVQAVTDRMTTTNLYSGIGEKNSSRVLKPPGGGHSDIFGEPDACPIKARPKHNQQNSSNMAFVCGTQDANEKVLKAAAPVPEVAPAAPVRQESSGPAAFAQTAAHTTSQAAPQQGSGDSKRVPPGGFSSGFW